MPLGLVGSRARRSGHRTGLSGIAGQPGWGQCGSHRSIPIHHAAAKGQQPGVGRLPIRVHDPTAVAIVLRVGVRAEGGVGRAGLLTEFICGGGWVVEAQVRAPRSGCRTGSGPNAGPGRPTASLQGYPVPRRPGENRRCPRCPTPRSGRPDRGSDPRPNAEAFHAKSLFRQGGHQVGSPAGFNGSVDRIEQGRIIAIPGLGDDDPPLVVGIELSNLVRKNSRQPPRRKRARPGWFSPRKAAGSTPMGGSWVEAGGGSGTGRRGDGG